MLQLALCWVGFALLISTCSMKKTAYTIKASLYQGWAMLRVGSPKLLMLISKAVG